MTFIDIILLALGWLLIAAGAVGIVWSLFLDRARGRKRCPKCWYDMRGVENFTCPECGRTVKREKKLFKTRRHWWRCAIALFLIILGCADFFWIRVRAVGWVQATPTWVYITMLSRVDDIGAVGAELERRIVANELTQSQRQRLAHQCIAMLESPRDTAATFAALDLLNENIRNSALCGKPWMCAKPVDPVEYERAVRAIVPLLQHEDLNMRMETMKTLSAMQSKALTAVPALLAATAMEDERTVVFAGSVAMSITAYGLPEPICDTNYVLQVHHGSWMLSLEQRQKHLLQLGRCSVDTNCLRPLLVDFLNSDTYQLRAVGVWFLAALSPDDLDMQQQIALLAADDERMVKEAVIASTSMYPLNETSLDILRRGLADKSADIRSRAYKTIDARGIDASPLLPDVESAMHNEPIVRDRAIAAHVAVGGDRDEALKQLLKNASEGSELQQIIALQGLLQFENPPPSLEAQKLFEPKMESADFNDAMRACCAYIKFGGDNTSATRLLVVANAHYHPPNLPNLVTYSMDASKLAVEGKLDTNVLAELLHHDSPRVRTLAVRYLGESGIHGASSLEELRKLQNDPDAQVAKGVETAVNRIEWAIKNAGEDTQ